MARLQDSLHSLFRITQRDYSPEPPVPDSTPGREESPENHLYVSTGDEDIKYEEAPNTFMSEQLSFSKPGLTTRIQHSPKRDEAQVTATASIVPHEQYGPKHVIGHLKTLYNEVFKQLREHYEPDEWENTGVSDQKKMRLTFHESPVDDQEDLDEAVTRVFDAGRFTALNEDLRDKT